MTTFAYNYRNQLKDVFGEMGFWEYYYRDYMGRIRNVYRYDTNDGNVLIASHSTFYDILGRVYITAKRSVDPETGDLDGNTAEYTWYDKVGNVMKRRNSNGAGFEKFSYDSLNRLIHRYAGYNLLPASYSEAETITDDYIYEQTDIVYDNAGNQIQTTTRERFHDTSGVGALEGPDAATRAARVNYTMNYPDPLGRIVAFVDYGTNGGVAPVRQDTIPPGSDNFLVSRAVFNHRGELVQTVDPKGTMNRQVFDDAGRVIKVIENYQP